MCYISAGSYEDWRPDAAQFPSQIKANSMSGWDELWLDMRPTNPYHNYLLALMQNRIITAANKGCQVIEFDNVDSWANDALPGVPRYDAATGVAQMNYNTWLAQTTHQYGMAVALKNDLGQIAELEPYFDLAVNEECFTYTECDDLQPFIAANKVWRSLHLELLHLLMTFRMVHGPSVLCHVGEALGRGRVSETSSAQRQSTKRVMYNYVQPSSTPILNPPRFLYSNATVACSSLSTGTNTVLQEGESFVWACPTGYEVVGESIATCTNGVIQPPNCQDIDECAAQGYTCSANAECVNTAGAYRCQCATGYAGNGKVCLRKDTLQESERIAYGGKYLQSSCGHVAAVSANGHMAMYAGDGVPYFSSYLYESNGPAQGATRFGLSTRGELLLVDEANTVLWRTGYQGAEAKTGPFSLLLDTSGYLRIMDGGNANIWTSEFYSPATEYDCWNYNPY
ncbi:hypothetical protein SARC_09502 [Sphaeroforma arctica JP610]|uniref:EGF-like domain-containing protein n=1 Tax=Sphaeroforma arctica JP610 TaxID=667725 RepID=A0A0L0FNK2_9EUKA|nr:hypothetical protein SARC_09502 [Sphaeroforma arctica JP610]KNC78056.1 hypothetical protein SARC_09502 [Sphaeroforma arctica JP610]|eukprot:XP_014151958.1 hypothetical protein SARC_09502 [Sphaeroforma arctica JP610]